MYKELTVQEAIEYGKHARINLYNIAADIYEETSKRYEDKRYGFCCAIMNIYNAGRINGIREDRAKRRGEKI